MPGPGQQILAPQSHLGRRDAGQPVRAVVERRVHRNQTRYAVSGSGLG